MNGKFFKLNIRVNTIQQIQSHYHIDHTTKAMNMNSLGNHNMQVIFQNNQVYHLQEDSSINMSKILFEVN